MPLPPTIPSCCHYHPNGLRCGSPAQRDSQFCYWHENMGRIPTAGILLELDTAEGIQLGIMTVLNAMLMGQMKSKDGGLMLYGLQIAASNLRNLVKAKELQQGLQEELVKQQTGAPADIQPPPPLSSEQEEARRSPYGYTREEEDLLEERVQASLRGDPLPDLPPTLLAKINKIHACADDDASDREQSSLLPPAVERAARRKAYLARFTKQEIMFLEEREKAKRRGGPVPDIPPDLMAKIIACADEDPTLDINACVDENSTGFAPACNSARQKKKDGPPPVSSYVN